MLETTFWILISIAIILIILGIISFLLTRKKKRPTDYYTLFIIGIIWVIIGIPLINYPLIAIGFVLIVIGLLNKKKWEKNKFKYSKLKKREKILYLIVMSLIALILIVGIVTFFLSGKESSKKYTVGINCPNNECNLLGASCGTVSPGYRDQCCTDKNINTIHIMCVGNWKYVAKTDQCVFYCE
jgi:MFS family permease